MRYLRFSGGWDGINKVERKIKWDIWGLVEDEIGYTRLRGRLNEIF